METREALSPNENATSSSSIESGFKSFHVKGGARILILAAASTAPHETESEEDKSPPVVGNDAGCHEDLSSPNSQIATAGWRERHGRSLSNRCSRSTTISGV